ncbi:MAG: dCTP deaminase [Candidatus Colwellbacteria bacterium RIFCSPHIGHO2_12_FULL_44_17]|uniref:dCTP deaminase, dUMP-forming n=2 Tax=Candidatus Colwelliibacteriota TaxID=1817904 RepID=A0A1G1Z9M0_9BACT|nr:MAG: dCTP deaminase [Candidatus Colwellbacteria bacterium RIFCSPHIGHO2_12_FULL_44_17]OGY60570.1 MAG: dCTP deaminase [Candidatus Colwellbacteria bacterium RIFCSPLOWO2_02_FULL_44_20b]
MLSDRDIKVVINEGKLVFTPALNSDQIGPASVDLKLDNTFLIFRPERNLELDPRKGLPTDLMDKVTLKEGDPFILHPRSFVLAATKEQMRVPNDLVLRVEGKSTLARMGILVHTAGFVDPGFDGPITLEISNHSGLPVLLYPGMYICQIAIHRLSSPAEVPYNKRKKSLYKGDPKGPTAAKTGNLF